MSVKPVRQITPPASRIWLAGLGATALATGANAGWLWICINIFHWEILVPEAFQSAVYVDASVLRVTAATAIAGALATLVAVGLAKLFIGPRVWFLAIGLGGGFASVYGALTLTDVSFSVKFALSVMHVLATFLVVLPVAEALKIRDSDLHRADVRYHEHLEAKNSASVSDIAGINMAAAGSTSASAGAMNPNTDTTIQPTNTAIIPTDSPTPDVSGSFDGGGFSDGGSSSS